MDDPRLSGHKTSFLIKKQVRDRTNGFVWNENNQIYPMYCNFGAMSGYESIVVELRDRLKNAFLGFHPDVIRLLHGIKFNSESIPGWFVYFDFKRNEIICNHMQIEIYNIKITNFTRMSSKIVFTLENIQDMSRIHLNDHHDLIARLRQTPVGFPVLWTTLGRLASVLENIQ